MSTFIEACRRQQEHFSPILCDQCAGQNQQTLANYVLLPEDPLNGPELGDPDFWLSERPEWSALCEGHYSVLTPDNRLFYSPIYPFTGLLI